MTLRPWRDLAFATCVMSILFCSHAAAQPLVDEWFSVRTGPAAVPARSLVVQRRRGHRRARHTGARAETSRRLVLVSLPKAADELAPVSGWVPAAMLTRVKVEMPVGPTGYVEPGLQPVGPPTTSAGRARDSWLHDSRLRAGSGRDGGSGAHGHGRRFGSASHNRHGRSHDCGDGDHGGERSCHDERDAAHADKSLGRRISRARDEQDVDHAEGDAGSRRRRLSLRGCDGWRHGVRRVGGRGRHAAAEHHQPAMPTACSPPARRPRCRRRCRRRVTPASSIADRRCSRVDVRRHGSRHHPRTLQGREAVAYEYRLLATSKTATMEKELTESG